MQPFDVTHRLESGIIHVKLNPDFSLINLSEFILIYAWDDSS